MYHAGRDPGWIDEVRGCRNVPNLFCPCIVIFVVAPNGFREKIADGTFARHMGFEFGHCGEEVRRDIATGNLDKGHAAVENDARGEHVLLQVKFAGVRPVVFVAAKPDDDDAFDDFGFEEDGGCHVGYRADSRDVERIGRGQCSVDEVAHRVAVLRRARCFEIARRAAKYQIVVGKLQAVEQADDFLIAPLHAISWPIGAAVVKRRGVQGLDLDLIGR